MAAVSVREADEKDCAGIFLLSKELMTTGANKNVIFRGTMESYRQHGFGNNRRYYSVIAEEETKITSENPVLIGFLLYVRTYTIGASCHVMHIEEIFVKEDWRRQGVGTALLTKTLQLAAEKGYYRVQLVTRKENTAAVNMYKRMGAINLTEDLGLQFLKIYDEKMKENTKSATDGRPSVEESQSTSGAESLVSVRDARLEDCSGILKMMKELAEYEEEASQYKCDKQVFKNDLFGESRCCHCIVAEQMNSSVSGKPKLIGFLLYSWLYKAYLGSDIMCLQSLFVKEKQRRQGVGKALFRLAMKTALRKGCGNITISVPQCNTLAMNFFKAFGAINLTENRGKIILVLDSL